MDSKTYKEKLNKDFFVDKANQQHFNKRYSISDFTRSFHATDELIIHCTAAADKKGFTLKSWDDPMALINYDLNPNHISRKGCPTATYHIYITTDGKPYQLVSFNIYTYNCSGHNKNSIAICINHGGVQKDVSPEAYQALVEACCYVFDWKDWGYDIWGVKEHLRFHRQHNPGKFCPGHLDYEQLCKDVSETLKTWGDNV